MSYFKPVVKVLETSNKVNAVIKTIHSLEKIKILIGIPDSQNDRTNGSGPGNATLGWLHTHGFSTPKRVLFQSYARRFKTTQSKQADLQAFQAYLYGKGDPMWHVPPRPFLEPALEAPDNKEKMIQQQAEMIRAALSGKPERVRVQANRLGIIGRDAVKKWFVDPRNKWAPNHPFIVRMKGSDKPLIDTGQLRNSIHYVIR